MMHLNKEVDVYLYTERVDFRKSINGLTLIVEQVMDKDLFGESLFVFTNRHRNRIKILYWQRNGFCLWYKILEQERFIWPKESGGDTLKLSGEALNWLLDGLDIWNNKPHKKLFFTSVS